MSLLAVYLSDVHGLGDGFDPSLYCHQKNFWKASAKRAVAAARAENASAAVEALRRIVRSPARAVEGFHLVFDAPTLFRDHFECWLTPPLDAWFPFDEVANGRDPKKSYAASRRGRWIPCGRRGTDLEVAIHLRAGDWTTNSAFLRLANALRILQVGLAADAEDGLHVLVVTDASPEGLASQLRKVTGIDLQLYDRRSDGVSTFIPATTVARNNVSFDILSGGHPLVPIHCLATADLILGSCDASKDPHDHEYRCSSFLKLAIHLASGVFVEVPTESLDDRDARDYLARLPSVATLRKTPGTPPP